MGLESGKADVQVLRQAGLHSSVQIHSGQGGPQAIPQTVPQRGNPQVVGLHLQTRQAAGLTESGDSRYVQCARSEPPLLPASELPWDQLHAGVPTADVQGTDSFGSINLVRGEGQQIDAHLLHIQREATGRLRRVREEQHTLLFT